MASDHTYTFRIKPDILEAAKKRARAIGRRGVPLSRPIAAMIHLDATEQLSLSELLCELPYGMSDRTSLWIPLSDFLDKDGKLPERFKTASQRRVRVQELTHAFGRGAAEHLTESDFA